MRIPFCLSPLRLLVITIVIVTLALTAKCISTYSDDSERVARLKARGAVIIDTTVCNNPWCMNRSGTYIYHLEIEDTPLDSTLSTDLSKLRHIEICGLGNVTCSPDIKLIPLGSSLKYIGIKACNIPDRLIIDLVSRSHIQGVHMTEMRISKELFESIVGNRAVRDIIFDKCTFPDDVFRDMKLGTQVYRFQLLDLRNIKQTSGCIDMLMHATSLSDLDLTGVNLSGQPVAKLSVLVELTHIKLKDTHATAADLEQLAASGQVQFLNGVSVSEFLAKPSATPQ